MEEIVPHEQALELKELGFDESTYTWRQNKNGISRNVAGKRDYYNSKGAMYTALPLYQQSFRWIRKNFKYSFYVKKAKKDTYRFYIEKFDDKFYNSEIYLSHEEAELEGLKKLIEIVKLSHKTASI